MNHIIALFGEAEKGDFQRAHFCQTLIDLSEKLGNPPSIESRGLEYAVQAVLYNLEVLYFRVKEEGFSVHDYLKGLNFLQNRNQMPRISAICLPGVGSHEIIEATTPVCSLHQSFLILTEKDLYDYLTSK